MSATGSGGSGQPRLRALKDQGDGRAIGISEWVREVRRLCAVLKPTFPGSIPGTVSVSHQAIQPPGGERRLVWRASCDLAFAETDQPESAMHALLGKLSSQLDERIKTQGEELGRLQDARRRGLKIAGGE